MSPQVLIDGHAQSGAVCLDRPWATRIVLEGFNTQHDLRLDYEPYQAASIPTTPCALSWHNGGERHSLRIEVPEATRPSDANTHQLRSWAELAQRNHVGTTAGNATDIPAISMGALLADLALTDLDDLLTRQSLSTLRSIAHTPRTWLRYDDEVLPVDRAQRISRNAERDLHRYAQWAAYHDGDIMLQRVLAEVSEDQLDLYENRVFTTLVHHLLERAQRRMVRCESSLRELKSFEDSLMRLERLGQYRRQEQVKQRNRQLTDERDKLAQLTAQGEQTLQTLQSQVAVLHYLLQSDVARACQRRAWWPLRDTNALSFDPRYRELPYLWRLLLDEEREREQLDPVLDDPDRTYSDFVLVAWCHALREAHFQCVTPDAPLNLHVETSASAPAHRSEWRAPGWKATLTREADAGSLRLEVQELQAEASPKPHSRKKGRTEKGRRGSVYAPGTAVTTRSARREPHHVVLAILPTFSPLESAEPTAYTDQATLWMRPGTPVAAEDPVHSSYFANVAGSPYGHLGTCTAAPWRFDSLDHLGRMLRRLTLWFDVAGDRMPDHCPACGGEGHCDARGDWSCRDSKCGVRWGKRNCRCGAVIPKVLPKRPPRHALDALIDQCQEHLHTLAEELGGRELLAALAPTADGLRGDTLVCPGCGNA